MRKEHSLTERGIAVIMSICMASCLAAAPVYGSGSAGAYGGTDNGADNADNGEMEGSAQDGAGGTDGSSVPDGADGSGSEVSADDTVQTVVTAELTAAEGKIYDGTNDYNGSYTISFADEAGEALLLTEGVDYEAALSYADAAAGMTEVIAELTLPSDGAYVFAETGESGETEPSQTYTCRLSCPAEIEKCGAVFALSVSPSEGADVQSSISISVSAQSGTFAVATDADGLYAELELVKDGISYALGRTEFQSVGDGLCAELTVDLGALFGSEDAPLLNADEVEFDLTAAIGGLNENYEVSAASVLTISGYSIQKTVNSLTVSVPESGANITYGTEYSFWVSQSEESGNPIVITQIIYEETALTQEEAAAALQSGAENEYVFDTTVFGAGKYTFTAQAEAGALTTAAVRQFQITVLPAVVEGSIAAADQIVSKQYDGTSAVTPESYEVALNGILEAEQLADARDYFDVYSADYYDQGAAAAGYGEGYLAVIVLELKEAYARNYCFADGTTRLTAELEGEILSNITFSYGNADAYHDSYYRDFQTVVVRVLGCEDAEAVSVTVTDGESPIDLLDGNCAYTESVVLEDGCYIDMLSFMQEGSYCVEVGYDGCGNGTETNATGLFYVDKEAPVITSTITEDYYNQTVEAVLTIDERFFDGTPLAAGAAAADSGVSISITGTKGNGAAVTAADYSCGGSWQAAGDGTNRYTCAVTLRENADYTITVVCVDLAGRKSTYERSLSLDKCDPKINITFREAADYAAGYYCETLYADVEISERNFDPELVEIVIRKNGAAVETADYVSGSWQTVSADSPDGTVRRLTLYFENDGAYTISVSCRDQAGNGPVTETTAAVTVDKTPPEISVSYDWNTAQNGSYYNAARTAFIQITEHNFNPAGVQITVIQRDSDGNIIEGRTYSDLSAWSGSGDVYTAELVFEGSANYEISVCCTDKAGLQAEAYTAKFTVDTDMPSGMVSVSGMGVWSRMFSGIVFGCFASTSRTVTITAEDSTSPVMKTEYLLASSEMTLAQLQADSAWQSYGQPFSLTPDIQAVVYVRLTDSAGNVTYLNSDGIILDQQPPAPVIEIVTPQPKYAIYNEDVMLTVNVCDTAVNGAYTGLASVRYEVYNGTELTQSGSFDCGGAPTNRMQLLSGVILVDSAKNNSDNITVYVYAEDNAGNTSMQQLSLNIDVTPPQVSAALSEASVGNYYGAGNLCQAELVVYEQNFDASLVTLRVLRDGVETTDYTISAWSAQMNRNYAERTKYTATVSFPSDGEYTFEVYCQDKAGNTVVYQYTESYTVDTAAPVISIGYADEITAVNQIYYCGDKTVVIRVQEHNFDAAGMYIVVTGSAAADGAPITIALPDGDAWTHTGDVHTYSFTLTEDGVYDITVMGSDKAGNSQSEIRNARLVIDHEAPQVTVRINDTVYDQLENKALNVQTIIPQITVTDNYGLGAIEVSIVSYGNMQEWELEKPEAATEYSEVFDGALRASEWTYDNIAEDGIYLITVRAADMAGNEAELFSDLISVNRNGSVFYLDKESFTYELVCGVTTNEAVSESFVIYESNVGSVYDTIISVETSRSGTKLLEEGTDYTVGETQETPYSLHVVSYAIRPEVFAQEEHYTISIVSRDEANNYNDSQIKNDGDPQEYDFFYDCTAPVLMFSGIEDMASYNQDSLRFSIDTNTGDLTGIARVELTVDGEKTVYGYGGDADLPIDESGIIEAVLEAAASRQRIQVSVTDGAGNVNDSYRFRVQVTTNLFWLFVYNTPLFVGTLAAILFLILLFVCIVVMRRRRRSAKAI